MGSALVSGTLLAVVVLVPLLILPGVFFHFDVTPKVVVLLAGTALALLPARQAQKPADRREMKWLRALLGLQALSLVVSTFLSTAPALSISGTNWRRFGLAVQLALVVYVYLLSLALPGVLRLLRAVALSGSLAALYGIAQYFGWDPWIPQQAYHIGEGIWTIVRPPGPLGYAGYFAVFLLHAAFAGVALAGSEKERQWKWAGAGAALLASTAILLSGTRAAMLGLAAGAVVLAVRRRPRLTLGRLAIGAAVFAGMILFYFSPAGLLLRSRTRWYLEDPQGGGRLTLWRDTLHMTASRWAAGYGPETFSSEFPRFQSEKLARQFPERYYESPHNIFLDALASQGAPGLLVLVLLCGVGLWAGRGTGPLADSLTAGLAASLVGNQFVSFILPTALLFYVTVAALAASGEPRETAPAQRQGRLLRLTVPLLLAAAFSFAWSDFWLARTRSSLEAGDAERAMRDYQRLRRLRLPGVDTDLWYSRALYAAAPRITSQAASRAAWQQSFQAALRASNTSEQRPNAYYNLAAFYALQNDFQGTEESLRWAIAWAPRWYKPHWMLAQVLRQGGRLVEAEAEARRAVELNAGKNPEVTQAWEQIQVMIGSGAARQKPM